MDRRSRPPYQNKPSASHHGRQKQYSDDEDSIRLCSDLLQSKLGFKKNSLDRDKPRKITRWSYYHEGDVEVPEICVYSIDNRCSYESLGCLRLHAKCTSQWQIMKGSNWFNFRNFHSKEIEDAFEDVTKDGVQLSPMDPVKSGKAGKGMFFILGYDLWEVDFDAMSVKKKNSPSERYSIRRLATQSSAVSKSAKATSYEWFFLNMNKVWVKYGEGDASGSSATISSITSDEIEKSYCTDKASSLDFKTSQFSYTLYPDLMQQKNTTTQQVRPVRRRPVKKLSSRPKVTKEEPKAHDLPSFWDRMDNTDIMVLVPLEPSSQEYRDVMQQMILTMPAKKVLSVKRVQSPFLWKHFKNKQDELSIRYGSVQKLNVQKLYHGTKSEHVEDICRENFDWRLHGTNVGQAYGRGTYFSNSAAFASRYCVQDSSLHCFLIVAEVILGEITKGASHMTRPPKNASTDMHYDTTVDNVSAPKIFVKYDKQEYCPMYVIEFM